MAISDQLKVGSGSKVAGASGVARDVAPGQAVFGYPALEFNEGFRIVAASRKLPELLRRVKILENSLAKQAENKE